MVFLLVYQWGCQWDCQLECQLGFLLGFLLVSQWLVKHLGVHLLLWGSVLLGLL